MHNIQDIMFAMEEEWNELENDARQDFQSLRDEIKNKVIAIDIVTVIVLLTSCCQKKTMNKMFWYMPQK